MGPSEQGGETVTLPGFRLMGRRMPEPSVHVLFDLRRTDQCRGKALRSPIDEDHQIDPNSERDQFRHIGKIGQPLGVDRPGQHHQAVELEPILGGQVGHGDTMAVGEEVGPGEVLSPIQVVN